MTTVISSKSGSAKPGRAAKRGARKQAGPTDDEIRILAYDLYRRRETEGADGDELSDWIEAKRQLAGKA